MQYTSFFSYSAATHFVLALFFVFLGVAVAVWVWAAAAQRKSRQLALDGNSSAASVEAPGACEPTAQFKANELAWLKSHQIAALAELLGANVFGKHRMQAIKVLCQSGLQQCHLDAVSPQNSISR